MSWLKDFLIANILTDSEDYSFSGGGTVRNNKNYLFHSPEDQVRVNGLTGNDVNYTVDQMLGGVIRRSGLSGDSIDVWPSSTDIVESVGFYEPGDSFIVHVMNEDSTDRIFITAPSGGSNIGVNLVEPEHTTICLVRIFNSSQVDIVYLGEMTHPAV